MRLKTDRMKTKHDFSAPARVLWHADEFLGPTDWTRSEIYSTLRLALDTVVNGKPRHGHPWIWTKAGIFSPHQVEDLWREDRML
jgi:hypothetical protein